MMFYSKSQIQKHTTETDCWLRVDYKVYNVYEFLKQHPEHINIILPKAGTDVSKDYMFYTKKMKQVWKQYWIGYINPFII